MVSNVRPSKKGFVLVVTCIALAILLGMAGLAVDAGRLYVVKSELQAFADAAALSAALELDGTRSPGSRPARQWRTCHEVGPGNPAHCRLPNGLCKRRNHLRPEDLGKRP